MRRSSHADEAYHHQPTVTEQLEGLGLFAFPAGSHPRKGSEVSADKIVANGRAPSLRVLTLERLAQGPVTASQWHQELEEALGKRVSLNSIAPRLSELTGPCTVDGQPFAIYDDSQANVSEYGATCCQYMITEEGRQWLQQREASRLTAGGSFGPDRIPEIP